MQHMHVIVTECLLSFDGTMQKVDAEGSAPKQQHH